MSSERSTSMRPAALGTALVFTASGSMLGTWVSRVPAVVARLDVSPGELGRALLALGIGSLLSMPLTGRACRRIGSRAWVAGTSVVAAVTLSWAGSATDLMQLAVTLFAFGMVYGSWDVAMNIQGSAVDQRAGREWMPRYHACWSLGSIVGAAAGSLAARAGVTIALHFTVAAWCATAAALVGLLRYIDERATNRPANNGPANNERATNAPAIGEQRTGERVISEQPAKAPAIGEWAIGERATGDPAATGRTVPAVGSPARAGQAPRSRRPARSRVGSRALLLIGLLTLCGTVIEGAAADWLALYLHTGRGLSEASAALGYTVFATAMTVVRFAGTPVAARLGRAGAVRAGGVLGIIGVLVTVLSPWTPVTYAGALLWGAGVCLVFPAAVSAAGETDRPADSIALVTSIGYGAILVGPPLIGALADVIGMDRALLTLAVLAAGVSVLAPVVRQPPAAPPVATPAGADSDTEQDLPGQDQPGSNQSDRNQSDRDHSDRDHSDRDHSGRNHSGRDHSGRDHSGRDQPGRDQSGSASIAR